MNAIQSQLNHQIRNIAMTVNQNKYNYVKVIQGNYGYGWEDVCEYDKQEFSTVKNDLKGYRLSNTGVYRVIDRRVLIKQ